MNCGRCPSSSSTTCDLEGHAIADRWSIDVQLFIHLDRWLVDWIVFFEVEGAFEDGKDIIFSSQKVLLCLTSDIVSTTCWKKRLGSELLNSLHNVIDESIVVLIVAITKSECHVA